MKSLCVISLVVYLCASGCTDSAPVSTSTSPSISPIIEPAIDPVTGASVKFITGNSITVGETVFVDIVMQDFPESQGGGLNLEFDPHVVQVIAVAVDSSVWSFYQQDGLVDNTSGKVSDIVFAAFPNASGDGNIVTVNFQGVSKGRALLRLTESAKNPFSSNGTRLDVSLGQTHLQVN